MPQDTLTSPSPPQAREMLREADATAGAATRWRPAHGAVAVVSLACAITAALAVTGAWWPMLAAWVLTLVLTTVLRSRLTRPGLRPDPWANPLSQGRSHWLRVLAAGCLPLVVIAARDALPTLWLPAAAAVVALAAGALCSWTLIDAARPRA